MAKQKTKAELIEENNFLRIQIKVKNDVIEKQRIKNKINNEHLDQIDNLQKLNNEIESKNKEIFSLNYTVSNLKNRNNIYSNYIKSIEQGNKLPLFTEIKEIEFAKSHNEYLKSIDVYIKYTKMILILFAITLLFFVPYCMLK